MRSDTKEQVTAAKSHNVIVALGLLIHQIEHWMSVMHGELTGINQSILDFTR